MLNLLAVRSLATSILVSLIPKIATKLRICYSHLSTRLKVETIWVTVVNESHHKLISLTFVLTHHRFKTLRQLRKQLRRSLYLTLELLRITMWLSRKKMIIVQSREVILISSKTRSLLCKWTRRIATWVRTWVPDKAKMHWFKKITFKPVVTFHTGELLNKATCIYSTASRITQPIRNDNLSRYRTQADSSCLSPRKPIPVIKLSQETKRPWS